MVSKVSRQDVRAKKHERIRNRFKGTAERPRLAVFRSNSHMSAQIIDDVEGKTLVSASTMEKEIKSNIIGRLIMDELKKIDQVAYVRFASVYQEFKSVDTFIDEINKLR